ncbi:hypothetical protein CDL12_19862 [Handroanthus impetiginosus]|uniref:Putative plant transposon protein domain-containing protein n=1 Tax=Handroanthus impetiginosus TaxID=429701 RepID=A0A2G9GQI5_9LAMI|nr:hypothetical protein CDL12_19862 [Handroanthus impetiginosus]
MAPKNKRARKDSSDSLGKVPIAERGFETKGEAYYEHIYHTVCERKWKTFIAQPESGVLPLFREFYANAAEHKNFKCLVRGREVPFDRVTINELYNIPPIELDEFENFCENGIDYEELTRTLCPHGAQWKMTKGEYISFKSNCLDKAAKIWLWFIFAQMLPTSHSGEVTADQALLLYCIMTGKAFDVGKIISNSIIQSANSSRDGLWFPSLITKLCTRAGVKWDEKEELIFPRHPIDNTTMLRILNAAHDEAGGSQPHVPRPIPGLVKKISAQEHRMVVERKVDYMIDYVGALARSLVELSRIVCNHIGIEEDKIPRFDPPSPPQPPPPAHDESEDEE